ncbi:MAG: radical SAM protein [Candidatus Thorarchaeota archaeon]
MGKKVIIFTKRFRNYDYELLFNEHNGLEILRGINGKADPFYLELPSLLDIGIMGSCKNKCSFCYQGDYKEPNMDLNDFKLIIDQTKHHVNQVALGGRGDPNKHEHFEEILKYCRKNKVVPNYTTSGIDLTDKEVELSKLCGAVGVSDYGKKYTFKAIKKFTDAGIRVSVHLIYTKNTHKKVMNILNGKKVWNNNIDSNKIFSVLFLLFKPQGSGINLDWIPTDLQLKEFSSMIFKPKSKFMVSIDSCLVNHILKYSKPNKIQAMAIDTCEGTRQSSYITPDMKMMPCSFADRSKFSVKITKVNDIYNIWNKSLIFKNFRNLLYQNPMKCPIF